MKKRLLLMTVPAVVVALLMAGFVITRPSPQYRSYESWSQKLNAQSWEMNPETAKGFSDANCTPLWLGHIPAFRIQSANHLKATSAVLMGYCPDAVKPYLHSVSKRYPEYAGVVSVIRKRVS